MYVELKEQYEKKYNSLKLSDKRLVDHILYMALGWGHANICSHCLQKYLLLPEGINLNHKRLIINDDYLIKKHIGEAEVCEMDGCTNEAEYAIHINEYIIEAAV